MSEEQTEKKKRRRLTMEDRKANLRAIAERDLAKAQTRESDAYRVWMDAVKVRKVAAAELAALSPQTGEVSADPMVAYEHEVSSPVTVPNA